MSKANIELLAPAGKWEVLEAVTRAGADAVYLGGKRFNMRLLRPEFNFSDQELAKAADYLHAKGKKLYVTVNNLYLDHELKNLAEYLRMLEGIGVDALIVQDLGVIELYKKLGLSVPMHASVQMSFANSSAVRFLENKGFTRVVLSKNLTLEEISSIHRKTSLGIEYFAHGDLCVSHTGQCYMSSFFKGEGPNRGRCIKSCRWLYKLHGPGEGDEARYHLACKDLCVFDILPRLIEAGVSSLKIEGRMRDSDYLTHLITIYRRALDGIIQNNGYDDWKEDQEKLQARRIRDFSYCNLLGIPGPEAIDRSGEREPIFISRECLVQEANQRIIHPEHIDEVFPQDVQMSVKVGDPESLLVACQAGVQTIILPGEEIRQSRFRWQDSDIGEAVKTAHSHGCKVLMETPRVVSEKDLERTRKLIQRWGPVLDGLLVNDLGSMEEAIKSGFNVQTGYGLNVFNRGAAVFLTGQGVRCVTASLELGFANLLELLAPELNIEILVHGPLCGMINDSCPASFYDDPEMDTCQSRCMQKDYALEDTNGQKLILRSDQQCRTYVYFPGELCNIGLLPDLIRKGLQCLRIDGQFYSSVELAAIISTYKGALNDLAEKHWDIDEYMGKLRALVSDGLTVLPDQVSL